MPPWIPNAISMLRILLVPAWLVLALRAKDAANAGEPVDRAVLVGVLLALGFSDVLDGFIARRFNLTSNLGATLDAVADKLAQVVTVTFLAFFVRVAFTPLPVWLWVALVVRDGVLLVGWLLVYRRHRLVEVEHRWHGKASSLVLFGVILAGTAALPAQVVTAGSAIALLLIVPGTVAYVREGLRQLSSGPRPGVRP